MRGSERDDVLSATDVLPFRELCESDDVHGYRARNILAQFEIRDGAAIPSPGTSRHPLAAGGARGTQGFDFRLAFDKNGKLTVAFKRKLKAGAVSPALVAGLFQQAIALDDSKRRAAGKSIVEALKDAAMTPVDHTALLTTYDRADDDVLRTQIAWAAQRVGIRPLVLELGPVLRNEPERRGVALDLLDDALRFTRRDSMSDFALAEMTVPTAAELEPPLELPRRFFALAEAPSHVVAAVEFSLTVGITKTAPTPGAIPFELPPGPRGEYDIVMTLQAIGFTLRDDVSVFTLHVTHADKYPTVDVFLTPDVVADKAERTISIFYSVDGQVIGSGECKVTVHADEDDETRNAERETWRRIFAAPTARVAPDLTVMISEDGEGNFAWNFMTPHPVTVPDKAVHVQVTSDAKTFAELLLKMANGYEGTPGLYKSLLGTGKDIRDIMPPQFWPILKSVIAAKQAQTASLLIISNEPYIPWELAALPKTFKLPYPDLAPFLGVQVCVGRWVNGDRLPPPHTHDIAHVYVLSGIYARPRWNRLLNAEAEAAAIAETYGATQIDATFEKILSIFDNEPAADLLHFSMHGHSDDDALEDGLIPIDTGAVKPQMISGAIENTRNKVAPFVFLNACQVGAGSRILGDYGGMAAAFIGGGAVGVVAPLWSVKDDLAKGIAIEFYKATLDEGIAPAEAIRRARGAFVSANKPVSATYLAYQFFGHPALQLNGSQLHKKDS
jgi:hypothetical protein